MADNRFDYPMQIVIWDDSVMIRPGWNSIDGVNAMATQKSLVHISMGFVWPSHDDRVVLIQSITRDGIEAGNAIAIPKTAVKMVMDMGRLDGQKIAEELYQLEHPT